MPEVLADTRNAVVIGMGGIGSALADALERQVMPGSVVRLGRANGFDPLDERSVERAAAQLPPLDLVIVTTGMLHDAVQTPEKSLRDLDPVRLARSFAINTIAPAVVARHVLPLLRRDRRAVFAVLGARVGSIGDNRTGGWHGYRASKAALVMLVKTLAIELRRTRPEAIIVALHPGTVDTGMSKPFQGNVPPGQLFAPARSAAHVLSVIDALTPADSGGHFAWDGARIPD